MGAWTDPGVRTHLEARTYLGVRTHYPFGSEAPGNVGDKDANWKRKHAYITRSQGSAPPLSKKLCKGYSLYN